MNIYVGNISFQMDDATLRTTFEAYGTVDSARVITDRETGRSRGFAFVEMPDDGEAQAAIDALNGQELDGRSITVNEARPRTERSGGGGGGYGGGGRGRGGDRRGGGGGGYNNRY